MSFVHVVTGAMFGSEGKGHVTAQLLSNPDLIAETQPALNIRVAGPNAGHTVIDRNGVAFPLRTVPVGAAVNEYASLYLAPGSEIELEVLENEVTLLRSHGHKVENLFISGEATVLEQKHKDIETSLDIHAKLGSTGKGIGAARADRIMRSATRFIDHPDAMALAKKIGAKVLDATAALKFIDEWVNGDDDAVIVIEGTQGYGLGLHAGHYPTCTSSDARAIDFLAMAGISPWSHGIEFLSIWLVARVYPIRVAGNSGPLKGETTWENLGLPIEKTTVTQKVRRVGKWDPDLIRAAAVANGAFVGGPVLFQQRPGVEVVVALTMADQKIPDLHGHSDANDLSEVTADKLDRLLKKVQTDAGVPVAMVTTGPDTAILL